MSIASYQNMFYKGLEEAVLDSDIQNGKIKVATDTARIFVDFNGLGRIEFTDFVRSFSSSEIEGGTVENPITSKIYIANDTGHLYVYIGSTFVDITNFKVTSAYNADSATYATSAGSATTATNATNATHATSADSATTATNATNSNTALTAGKATNDGAGNNIASTYAPLNSPTLTGTPNAPTPSSNDDSTRIATTAWVQDLVNAAIGTVSQFHTAYVNKLPATGDPHTIYFTPDPVYSNACKESIWITVNGVGRWETIGSSEVTAGVAGANVTGTGNAITGASVDGNGILQLVKNSTFLTSHPTIATSADTTNTGSIRINGTGVALIDTITRDSNGHVKTKNSKTVSVTGPDCISYDSTNKYWDMNFGSLDSGF